MTHAVTVKDLGKVYRMYPDSASRLVEWVTRGRVVRHSEKWALRGVSFDLEKGSALGVIGGNRAGKSTLLKILTGTTRASCGGYAIHGRLGSLLELGAGFHPEFSGRDNLYMNAAILGVPKDEVRRRFEEVADFADIGDYIERPVRTYSSGMAMRLGFAVAMMANPDILILDEILAVGDQHFQKKCFDRIKELRNRGTTFLFVSHSTYHIRQICDRALWLQGGEPVMIGDPTLVTDEYVNYQYALSGGQSAIAQQHGGEGALADLPHLVNISLRVAGTDVPTDTFRHGDRIEVRIRWKDRARAAHHAGFIVYRNDDTMCFGTRTTDQLGALDGEDVEVVATLPLQILAGEYYVSGFLLDDSSEHVLDQRLAWARFKVTWTGMEKGVFRADVSWKAGG